MTLAHQLDKNLRAINYDFPFHKKDMEDHLLEYVKLINKWNRVHNLTAIRTSDEILSHHIVDSLSVMPHINGKLLADIGSGAGLPGIPIAIVRPDWKIVLIESNQKKAAFLHQVKIELKLDNIEVYAKRVELYRPDKVFNTIISRALSSLTDFIQMAGHLYDGDECRIVAMKGQYSDRDHEILPRDFLVEKVIPITVPGLNAERHLVIIKKTD